VINQIKKLPPEIQFHFDSLPEKLPSNGVRFYAPNNSSLEIPFPKSSSGEPSGYLCKRRYIDNLLAEQLKNHQEITFIEECEIINIENGQDEINVHTKNDVMKAKILIGADGAHSIVAKKLSENKTEKEHTCLALRTYFENVTGFHDENFIELHFYEELLPGYLWLFPMADNRANVGIGMPANIVSEKKIILKDILEKLITEHPNLVPRFKHAKQLENFQADRIPLGSKKRNISGEHYLLIGDAASLVDPFTGEGIGNAIRSGRIAGEHIVNCFEKQYFSAAFNKQYDKEIYRRMGKELKWSYTLQKLFKHPKLINYAVNKANRNENFKNRIINSITNVNIKSKFLKPYLFLKSFYK